MRRAVAEFLAATGVDPDDPEIRATPERVTDAWCDEIVRGYERNPREHLRELGTPNTKGAVVITGIAYVSTCPHHLLPYVGTAHIAYLPDGRTAGFGSIVRVVEDLGARLVLQETLAQEVAELLQDGLGAKGAACHLEAQQMCMAVRGVRRHASRVTCSAFTGAFENESSLHRRSFQDAIRAWHTEPRVEPR